MVYFGPFEFDPATHELRRDDTPVALERQPAIALDLLVSRPGRLVRREEVRRAIWPDGVHVDFDRGMNYCIRQLRAALEDDARQPRYIETVPRQGYRFVALVQQPCAPNAVAVRDAPRGSSRARVLIAAVAVIASLTAGGLWDSRFAAPETKATHHAAAVRVLRAVHAALF
jgi:DNA-binding winged helix-turn-helix (wHTH) protein